jgi:hypothetical protein
LGFGQDHNLFFGEPEIFCFHMVNLPVNRDGPDDECDRNRKLENNKNVPETRLGFLPRKSGLKDSRRMKGRKVDCRIAPGEEADD